MESLPTTGGRPLAEAVPKASREALDFLNKTLRFSPDKRCTVGRLLEHQYLSQLHCPEDEPVRDPLDIVDFEFERRKVDMKTLREEVFLEALLYHPQRREQYQQEQKRTNQPYSITNCRLLTPGESQYSSDDDS